MINLNQFNDSAEGNGGFVTQDLLAEFAGASDGCCNNPTMDNTSEPRVVPI